VAVLPPSDDSGEIVVISVFGDLADSGTNVFAAGKVAAITRVSMSGVRIMRQNLTRSKNITN
jgi:hypothetical protein